MKTIYPISVTLMAIALVVGVCIFLKPRTIVAPQILSTPALNLTADEILRQWLESDKSRGWYCERVGIPANSILKEIAPSCDFIRFTFRRDKIAAYLRPSPVERRVMDVAIMKSSGENRIVLAPWGFEFDKYPEFLVWAKCRVDSEADAAKILSAMFQTRDGLGGYIAYATRDGTNRWKIGFTVTVDEPVLIIETDDEGYVVGGKVF